MNALAKIDDAALCSIELEQEILGSVIISNAAATVLEHEVFASDFSKPLTLKSARRSAASTVSTGAFLRR